MATAPHTPGSFAAFEAALAAVDWAAPYRRRDIDLLKQTVPFYRRQSCLANAVTAALGYGWIAAYSTAQTITRDGAINLLFNALQDHRHGTRRLQPDALMAVRRSYVAERLARFRDRATARQLREVAA